MGIRVGVLKVDFCVTGSQSLKEKRFVMNRLRDRVRNTFNVSISEVDHHDKWQIASFGISCISNDKRHVDATLNKVRNFFEKDKNIAITDFHLEII